MYEYVLVLYEDPGDDSGMATVRSTIEQLEDDVGYFAFPRRVEKSPSETHYVWAGRDESEEIVVIDNFDIPARYLVVRAQRPAHVEKIGLVLSRRLRYLPETWLRKYVRDNMVSEPNAVMRWALCLTEIDDDAQELMSAALSSSSQRVRLYCAMAVAWISKPEMIPALQSLLRTEPDDRVRDMAKVALDGCRRELSIRA